MVAVFLVFVTLSFLDFKEMGLGLAVGVLIDATVIRGVQRPAATNARRLELWRFEFAHGPLTARAEEGPDIGFLRSIAGKLGWQSSSQLPAAGGPRRTRRRPGRCRPARCRGARRRCRRRSPGRGRRRGAPARVRRALALARVRQKRSNSSSGCSVGRPGPWSRTSSSHLAAVAPHGDLDGRARRRVHERVAHQVGEHLAQLVGVAEHDRLVAGVHLDRAGRVDGACVGRRILGRAAPRRPPRPGGRAPRRAARASAGPRPARPCARPPPRSGSSRDRRPRACARPRCGTARSSRGSTPAACAARATRRRGSAAAASRSPRAGGTPPRAARASR